MKHTIFLLFLLLLSTQISAQNPKFNLIIHKPFNAALFDITENYDRTITAVGFSKEFKKNAAVTESYSDAFEYLASISGSYGSQMHIVTVDNNAKIILSKHAKLPKFNEAIAVVKTPSNGYFIGGYTLDGSLLILKLDAKANVLFSKTFGTKNYDRMSNLILMSDGGVLAVGSSITSRDTRDNMFTTGLGNNDIYITRFTKEGKMLWSKKYGTMHDDRGIDAVEASDGSIVVISTTSYEKNRDVTLMRLTENGNKIWLKHYKDEKKRDNTIVPSKIIKLRDNNFVIALTQYNHMQKEHIRLIKFDLYENILIDKEIFTTYPSAINDIKEYSDGKFIAVGYVKDVYNTDGLAMIFDPNFVLLTQEHYGQENYDVFHAVTLLHNSQAAVAGVHTDNSSQETNMWITKLNSDATQSSITTTASDFYKQLTQLFKEEIAQKKLKIKEDLSIEFTQNALYFQVGAYQLTAQQKSFLLAFTKKLIPFLYKHKEHIETLEINGFTSSEWADSNFAQSYIKNADLSLKRSFETFKFLFQTQEREVQKWLIEVLKESGHSYANRVTFSGIESKKLSRRVTMKIILKR